MNAPWSEGMRRRRAAAGWNVGKGAKADSVRRLRTAEREALLREGYEAADDAERAEFMEAIMPLQLEAMRALDEEMECEEAPEA